MKIGEFIFYICIILGGCQPEPGPLMTVIDSPSDNTMILTRATVPRDTVVFTYSYFSDHPDYNRIKLQDSCWPDHTLTVTWDKAQAGCWVDINEFNDNNIHLFIIDSILEPEGCQTYREGRITMYIEQHQQRLQGHLSGRVLRNCGHYWDIYVKFNIIKNQSNENTNQTKQISEYE